MSGRRLVQTSVAATGGLYVQVGTRALAVLLLASVLGPAGQGDVAFAAVIATVGALLALLGLEVPLSRDADEDFPHTCAVGFRHSGSAVLVGAISGALILLAFGSGYWGSVACAIGLIVAVRVGSAVLLAGGNTRSSVLIGTLPAVLYLGSCLVAASADQLSVRLAVALFAGSYAIPGVLALIALRRGAGDARANVPSRWRNTYLVGLQAYPGMVAGAVSYRADQVVLGLVAPSSALGLYSVAVAMAETGSLASQGLAQALLASGRRARIRLTQVLGALIAVAGIYLLAAVPVYVITTRVLSGYSESFVLYIALFPAIIGLSIFRILSAVISGAMSPRVSSHISLAAAFIGVILYLLLIPSLHEWGAVIGSTVAYLVGASVALVAVWPVLRSEARERSQ